MNERVYYTILIYVQEGQLALLHEYERLAQPIIEKYSGRFEQIIQPTQIVGDLPLPDEIHVLSFANEAAFSRYRQDPDSQALAPMREASVAQAIFISGKLTDFASTV